MGNKNDIIWFFRNNVCDIIWNNLGIKWIIEKILYIIFFLFLRNFIEFLFVNFERNILKILLNFCLLCCSFILLEKKEKKYV